MSALSTTAWQEYYMELVNAMPWPVIDKLEYRERRLNTLVEAFKDLRPGDAYEGRLAVRIVLCGAHASECLREADLYRADYAKRTRCRAQAASMMRAEDAAKRTLEREQKVRLAGEAVAGMAPAQPAEASATPPQAAPHAPPPVQAGAAGPPAAVQTAATPPPAVQTAAAPPPPAPVQPAATPPRPAVMQATPAQVRPGSAPAPSPEAIAKAELFALDAGVAAARIRHDGGVTPQSQAHFRHVTLPTDPAVIDALVRGSSAALRALDGAGGEMLDAAD